MTLGLIVVGDYALATGTDRHVAFAASLLGRTSHALEWAWLIPANRVQLAASLHEAWQRPHPVACFGGLATLLMITFARRLKRCSKGVMRSVCRVMTSERMLL